MLVVATPVAGFLLRMRIVWLAGSEGWDAQRPGDFLTLSSMTVLTIRNIRLSRGTSIGLPRRGATPPPCSAPSAQYLERSGHSCHPSPEATVGTASAMNAARGTP